MQEDNFTTADGAVINGGGSRPSDKTGGGHPDPEIGGEGGGGGRSEKTFFRPFGPHFGIKIWGGTPPGPLPWIRH